MSQAAGVTPLLSILPPSLIQSSVLSYLSEKHLSKLKATCRHMAQLVYQYEATIENLEANIQTPAKIKACKQILLRLVVGKLRKLSLGLGSIEPNFGHVVNPGISCLTIDVESTYFSAVLLGLLARAFPNVTSFSVNHKSVIGLDSQTVTAPGDLERPIKFLKSWKLESLSINVSESSSSLFKVMHHWTYQGVYCRLVENISVLDLSNLKEFRLHFSPGEFCRIDSLRGMVHDLLASPYSLECVDIPDVEVLKQAVELNVAGFADSLKNLSKLYINGELVAARAPDDREDQFLERLLIFISRTSIRVGQVVVLVP